jgi:hypothetical protein
MKPMEPMPPMEPMQTLQLERWWPADLGTPASAGSAQDLRYAYFPERRRLIVERDGKRTLYDTGEHQFRGVIQSSAADQALSFSSQHGRVELNSLVTV